MVVRKEWLSKPNPLGNSRYSYEGWFLFGIIPLYVRRYGAYP